jgi:hypothetical protein
VRAKERTENSPRERDPCCDCQQNRLLAQHHDRARQTRLHHLPQTPPLEVVLAHVPLITRLLPQPRCLAREKDRRSSLVKDEIADDGESGGDGEEDPVDVAEAFDLREVAEANRAETGAVDGREGRRKDAEESVSNVSRSR